MLFWGGSAFQILRHPGVTTASLKSVIPELADIDLITLSRIDIDGQLRPDYLFCSKILDRLRFL